MSLNIISNILFPGYSDLEFPSSETCDERNTRHIDSKGIQIMNGSYQVSVKNLPLLTFNEVHVC